MSNKSPIFPIFEPQHFSDYGFDPQIDYFQVLEEVRKHKRESSSRSHNIDLHFKLQKPISKDESSKKKIKKNKKRWWRNALLFFKFDKLAALAGSSLRRGGAAAELGHGSSRIRSISGPLYVTETTKTTGRRISGELMNGEVQIPYISLREVNMDQHRISTTAPIYLVT